MRRFIISFCKVIILFLVTVAVAIVIFVLVTPNSSTKRFADVSFAGMTYRAEIADTYRTRALGLGGRESLCPTCAMLFLFREPENLAFWMKDMRFPLDIVWLLDDKVVFIERSVSAESDEVYRSDTPANRVLEVNAGVAQNLHVGDIVIYSVVFP